MNAIGAIFSPAAASSALNSGAATVAAGAQQLDLDAQQIANPQLESAAPLLDLSQASELSQMGAAVMRASDQMLGTLLDIFA